MSPKQKQKKKMNRECPVCGSEMRETKNWPGEWLWCPECLHTEKKYA